MLAVGPDVMFEVWDRDPDDDCFEVVTANFFDEKISLYSLQATKYAQSQSTHPCVLFALTLSPQQ